MIEYDLRKKSIRMIYILKNDDFILKKGHQRRISPNWCPNTRRYQEIY